MTLKHIFLAILTLVLLIIFLKKNIVDIEYNNKYANLLSSKYECVNTSNSSFMTKACYDKNDQYLILGLKDKYYNYCNLGESDWDSFKNAYSFGENYNQNIKGNYSCKK